MALNAGTRLGPYEVIAPLGAGGMGEVYRARDSRLGRDVAIKVLPEHLNANPEVRARFEREAKTISSLNHPNICTLFDVGSEGGHGFLVMELVEGETLAQRLAKGTLPASDVIKLGVQIADALDRAHRAGVIHRDLKPGNIMLTRSGAKLMDFGLARRASEGGTGLAGAGSGAALAMTQSPTVAAPLTAEGTILGTFQYMAPEQLEGRVADARSDVWALGCVLYEMASGKRAFEGKSQASMIGAIMTSEPPPLSVAAPLAPPALDELVRTCLAKDAEERWQSAGDLRRELQRIQASISGSGSAAVAPRRRRMNIAALGWIVAGMIGVAAIVMRVGPWSPRHADSRLMAFTITAPAGMALSQPAEAQLSPDSRMLAYTAIDSGGASHLFVRRLEQLEAREIAGTRQCTLPFWSPDSRQLAFFAEGKLRKVALDGGAPVVLCDAVDPRGGSWSGGDIIVFAPSNQGPIMRVPAKGGVPVQVTTVDAGRHERGHRYPQFLPDGKQFLFVAITPEDQVATYAASIDGGPAVEVCRGGTQARYAAPGYLLYLDAGVNVLQRRLLAKRFDAARLKTQGDAQLLLDDVKATNFGYANVTTDPRGDLVVQHWADVHQQLEWRDRSGHALGEAVADLDGSGAGVSPDGGRIAFSGNKTGDVYTQDLTSGVVTRLTFESRQVSNVIWSRDGHRLAFARLNGTAGWEARVKSADGTGPDSLLFHAPGLFTFPESWSPDGRWLVARGSDSNGNMDLWRIPMAGQGAPELYQRTPGQELNAQISPDGNWVAYVVVENGTNALYVQSFPAAGSKYEVSATHPGGVLWSERGDELIVFDQKGAPSAIEVSTVGGFHQGASHKLFDPAPATFVSDYAPASQRFLVARLKDVAGASSLEAILGWPALLEKK